MNVFYSAPDGCIPLVAANGRHTNGKCAARHKVAKGLSSYLLKQIFSSSVFTLPAAIS